MDINRMTPREPNKLKRILSRFSDGGVELCNSSWPCFGGHNWWLAHLLDVDYLWIGFHVHKPGISHFFYDGFHHGLHFGIITINWGGRPFIS